MAHIDFRSGSTNRRGAPGRRWWILLAGTSLLALGAFAASPQLGRDGLTVAMNQALADSGRDGGDSGGHGGDDSGSGSDNSGPGSNNSGPGSDNSGHRSANSGPGNAHDNDDDDNDDGDDVIDNDDDDGTPDQGRGDVIVAGGSVAMVMPGSDDGTPDQGRGDN